MIFHLALQAEWTGAQSDGRYVPAGFAREGFVHCASAAQVEAVANRYFAGRADLLLLSVDPDRLGVPLRWEAPVDPRSGQTTAGAERYPHVYGPIPLAAVLRVQPLQPSPDGTFRIVL